MRPAREPREPQLARDGQTRCLLHLLAGLSPGWIQSGLRHIPVGSWRESRQTQVRLRGYRLPVLYAALLRPGQPDQQRVRLEDRVVRTDAAVQRRVYQEKWKNVQTQFFDPSRARQPDLHHQWPQLPRSKGSRSSSLAGDAWPDFHGRRPGTAPSRPIPRADRQQSYARDWRIPPSVSGTAADPACRTLTACPAARSRMSPPFQGNIRGRYELPINAYHAFVQAAGAAHIGETDLADREQRNAGTFDRRATTTYDASCRCRARTNGRCEVYGQNLGNNLLEHVHEQQPVRPHRDDTPSADHRPQVRLLVQADMSRPLTDPAAVL